MRQSKDKSGSPRFLVGDKVRVKYGVIVPDFLDIPLGGMDRHRHGDRTDGQPDHL